MNENDFKLLSKFGKGSNILMGKECKSLIDMTYGFVKFDLPFWTSENEIDKIIKQIAKENKIKDCENETEVNKIKLILWIKSEIEWLNDYEKDKLSTNIDNDLLSCGVEELSIFGELNNLYRLAKENILNYRKILKLPYSTVLDTLHLENVQKKIEKRYHDKLKNKK